MIEEQRNNPLHGVKLEALLTELVEHYGWEALASALNLNCFKSNPSIKSSLKFLRKTLWAREKVEAFYLYKYKRLPKPDDTQYALPPRDRTVPLDQKPRSPAPITAAPTKKDRAPRTEARRSAAPESRRDSGKTTTDDVWSKWRKKDSD